MNCCRGKRDAQTESGSKRDEESAKSLEEDEEEVDPDALKTWQVATAVVLLSIFSLSFATSFYLMNTAINSLSADFDSRKYMCSISHIATNSNVQCVGDGKESPCIEVILDCAGFNQSKVMYPYYQNYYKSHCSATRCREADRAREDKDTGKLVKYPLTLVRECCTLNKTEQNYKSSPRSTHIPEQELYRNLTFTATEFYYDRNKPDAMFYQMNELGTNNLVLSKPLCYAVIMVPLILMVSIGVALVGLFVTNKLTAKEIYRPLTPITPMHKKVKGKWYIKEPNPTDKPKMNAFEKLQNIKKQQEEMTSSSAVKAAPKA